LSWEGGRINSLLDNLADAVTIHDAEGRLVYVNKATGTLMGGQSRDEIVDADPGA
jgi:PAS domain-containing protein